jgi:hypothetical protein
LPLFELPKFTENVKIRVKYQGIQNPIEAYIQNTINEICIARGKLPILLDISRWKTDATIETGEHILSYSIDQLVRFGIPVTPVIGYDRWDDIAYSNAILGINNHEQEYCIRLDEYAFEDMLEETYFYDNLNNIINLLNINTRKCSVLLDFSDVTQSSIDEIQEKTTKALRLLSVYDFEYLSISGCSISPLINTMVSNIDSTATVLRREMVTWKALRALAGNEKLVFGDYGIVSPKMQDDITAPDANGKIRYTYSNNYLVARGHSRRKGNKGEQMWDLSREIVESPQYMKERFSWGDKRIMSCANEEFKGNPSNWVAIDTNHHIHAVIAEIYEFERSIISHATKELAL